MILAAMRRIMPVCRAAARPCGAPGRQGRMGAMKSRRKSSGRQSRRCDHRRRRADRRAVDDQHRYRGHRGHGGASQSAGARRIRIGARHGQQRRIGRRRAAHSRTTGRPEHRHAVGRRFPLQRPQAAEGASRLRAGAGQAAHQSGQRRPRQQARSAIRRNDRNRLQVPQAGAHRRELGQPRSGPAHPHDGREFEAGRTPGRRST